jgi:hypothetical protein
MSRGGEFPRKRGRNLRCVECRCEQAAGELGWKAYLTTDEDEAAEAVVYCPECATREFGRRGGR